MTRDERMRLAATLVLLIGLCVAVWQWDRNEALAPARPARLDVNHASVEALVLLPGIGPARARAIVAERERSGGFRSLDDLLQVRGIGADSLLAMRPYLRIDSSTEMR